MKRELYHIVWTQLYTEWEQGMEKIALEVEEINCHLNNFAEAREVIAHIMSLPMPEKKG